MQLSPLLSCIDGRSSDVVPRLVALEFPKARTYLDPTWGHGNFWTTHPSCLIRGDRARERAKDVCLDFRALPFLDAAFDVVVFDPPFQPATVDGVIGRHFSKPVKGITGLRSLVEAGLQECWRVCKQGMVVKVQDYIHDHKPVWMSLWVHQALGEPWDFLVLRSTGKPIAKNWTRQLSVWRNHSTFWVYAKNARR